MKTPLDLTTYPGTIHEVKAAVLFVCPYCGGEVRTSMRVRYPETAIGVFAPVYRCGGRNNGGCGRYVGAPVVGEDP